MGFSISEIILSVEEGIMGETKSFLTFISKTANLYLCQLFFDCAFSLKQSSAQYFFMKHEASCVCAITAAFTTHVTFRQLPTRYQRSIIFETRSLNL